MSYTDKYHQSHNTCTSMFFSCYVELNHPEDYTCADIFVVIRTPILILCTSLDVLIVINYVIVAWHMQFLLNNHVRL